VIPDSSFENDVEARPLPFSAEQQKEFDEQIEALRKFKK